MDSNFLKKFEEEKKLAQEGKAIDDQMEEEDEDDDDDEEMNDQIQELTGIQDGVGAIKVNDGDKAGSGPVKAVHTFNVPKTQGMGGMPMPPTGAKPFKVPSSKYDPAEWDQFFDWKEKLDDRIPVYHAGQEGHVFLCLHGAGHSALSFTALAKILK